MPRRRACRLVAASLLAAALAPAAVHAQSAMHGQSAGVRQLAWLSGCWAADGGEPGSGETWTTAAGGTLLGTGRTIRKGRTVEHEFMVIQPDGDEGRLSFSALPSGQRLTRFVQVKLTADEVVFENPQHDFPQRVAYRRDGPRLKARIEGLRNGSLRVIEFPMTRIGCDAAPEPASTASSPAR
jgi:hypothetical protein